MTAAQPRILLGVSGGIAAYKAVELVRCLVAAGARTRVVLTQNAAKFVTPMTFQAVTGEPVRVDLFDERHEAAMGHIELARWPDAVLLAPASAHLLARLSLGLADDLLTTLCLATEAPILAAPAMNRVMWAQPATQAHAHTLQARGVTLLGPASGAQACGEHGAGRMWEPAALCAAALERARTAAPHGGQDAPGRRRFHGCRALVTAGPTREALDPVRYLGNRSSGKMGYAVAAALQAQGAEVQLISGPGVLPAPPGVQRRRVESALQMHAAVMEQVADCELFVACAAVADYRPRAPRADKIKKSADTLQIELVRNPDILAEVAALPDAPFTVGFAAETTALADHAREKLTRKGIDMIAANQVGEPGTGFDSDVNALLVIWPGGQQALPAQDKPALARALVTLIADRRDAQTASQNSG